MGSKDKDQHRDRVNAEEESLAPMAYERKPEEKQTKEDVDAGKLVDGWADQTPEQRHN